ncbi:MAG: RluA family pseudouridine synthase [Polyangiaceae bacterium]
MRFAIDPEDVGARLDKLLCAKLPGVGRAAVKKLFVDGKVRVVSPTGTTRRAAKGDIGREKHEVEVDLPAGDAHAVADPAAPLNVVFETEQVVVVDKPAGQPTAPLTPGETGALANALAARYPEMAECGFSPREPGLCHRLDTDTSGLVLAARTKAAWQTLTDALKSGRLDKRYLLLVSGDDVPENGTIEIPLAPHPKDRRRVLACVHPRDVARNEPRPATTTWTRLAQTDDSKGPPITLIEARAPKALRHQLRAHFAAIGFPLLGDALYGGDTSRSLSRHALHAHRIAWGGDAVVPAFVVVSPLPADLARLLPPEVVESLAG